MVVPTDRANGGGRDDHRHVSHVSRGRSFETLRRFVVIEPHEMTAVAWSWLFFFTVLTAYYVLRPIRDDMGVAGGVQNLPWLFAGTLTGMLVANPAFGFVATRVARERLVSIGYRFFAINLLLFFVFLSATTGGGNVWAGRVFFVWTAVFNMFAVSIFWSVMTDSFAPAQGKRLFGLIGVGGTIGAITGAGLTSTLVGIIGAANLLLVSAGLLEVASFAARRVFRHSVRDTGATPTPERESALGGSAWDGLRRTVSEPYLFGIACHIVLYTVLTTFLYFQQATIVDATFTDRVARTRFFANVELSVNTITLLTQLFLTARIVRIFGLPTALAYLPALSLIGFLALGFMPTIAVLMTFQVIRRGSEFGIARPSREVLFTSVPPADRYKAKNFIDTVVYRVGDQIGAWSHALLVSIGLGISGVSAVASGLAVIAIGVAIWLGRRQRALESGERVLAGSG
jgi:AAA family ATP:ADP antiporter